MHHDSGKCLAPVRLPVAVAKNANTGLDFDQPLLRLRNREPARQDEAGDCLKVSTREEPPWAEVHRLRLDFGNDGPHKLILVLSWLYSFVPAQAEQPRAIRSNLKMSSKSCDSEEACKWMV